MRKTLALFIAVLILSLSLYILVFAETNKEKDNVIVTESHIYGDKSFAENVAINVNMQYRENLLWNIKYSIGDGKIKTDFSIHKNRIKREYNDNSSFTLYSGLHYGSTNLDYADKLGLNKAYRELVEEAEPYEELERTIRLTDYLEYYPIIIDGYFPDGAFSLDTSIINTTHIMDEKEKELVEALSNFFRIPVMESHEVVISVLIDENRNILQTGSSGNDGERELDEFYFNAESVVTDKECFIFFRNKTRFTGIADTSEIPGGYGIYRLPYSYSEYDSKLIFDCESLKNIFPVDEKEEVQQLQLSADKKDLYMISQKENKTFLTVIDAESYKEKSKITLSEKDGQESSFGYIGVDFMVINHYHENINERFSVYLPDGKGGFKEEFSTDGFAEDGEYVDTDGNTHYPGTSIYMYSTGDVKWDGENLYVTNGSARFRRPGEYNSFTLGIYNKDGLKFCGQYYTSLSTGYDGYQASSYYTFLSQHDTIEIELG